MKAVSTTSTSSRLVTSDLAVLIGLSSALFLYHILTAAFSHYGYFIDEFYYIAMLETPGVRLRRSSPARGLPAGREPRHTR